MARRRSTPQSVVSSALEQQGKTRTDLVPLLGSRSRVSEFLAGKRRLSLSQIAAVRKALGIPADLLIESKFEIAGQGDSGNPGIPSIPVEPPAVVERVVAMDDLLTAQQEFIVRLTRLLDEASRSMGKRW